MRDTHFALQEPYGCLRGGATVAAILVSLVTVLLVFALIELGLRIFPPASEKRDEEAADKKVDMREHALIHRRSGIPGLFYELNPNTFTITRGITQEINSLGMRDREYPPTKPPGTFRILILGDSVTYGWGVSLEDIYTEKLEAMLNDVSGGNPLYEVLNLAVSGYNTEQEVALLKARGIALGPDLVVIGLVTNDIQLPFWPLSNFLSGRDPEFLKVARKAGELGEKYTVRKAQDVLPNWLSWSRTACMVWQRIENTRKGDFLLSYYNDRERWESMRSALREAAKLLDARGTGLFVTVFPENLHIMTRPSRREIHAKIDSCLMELGIPFVDLFDTFANEPVERIVLDPHDPHPSPYGHELAAKKIFSVLTEKNLIRIPRGDSLASGAASGSGP